MGKRPFYDGTKLLSMKDKNGHKPEIYMCVGNRTAGKSYFFKRLMLRRYVKNKEKFCILVRFAYELDGVADNFFKDLEQIDFKGHELVGKPFGKDLFVELFFDGKHCGYAAALNTADTIKKYSARFVDVNNIFFDEFQSETGKYCPDELTKFQSMHVSIARGGGKHVRYVPVYMCSNTVTVLNPYFAQFDVTKRLQKDTKFLKGDGWVLENCYVDSAAEALKQSGFARAFANSDYMAFATTNDYLLDNEHFIEKVKGEGWLVLTIVDGSTRVGLWEYREAGLWYVSHKYDPRHPHNIALYTDDHNVNTMMIKLWSKYAQLMRTAFEAGQMRFEDQTCKNIALDFLRYSTLERTKKKS